MKFSSFRYLVKQGWHNMVANRLMTLASVGVLTACLFITGVAALLSANVNSFVLYLQSQNEIEVFFNDDISAEETQRVQQELSALENISNCTYISKAQAVVEQMAEMDNGQELLEGYMGEDNPNNPLPASMRLTLADIGLLDTTILHIRDICGEYIFDIASLSDLSQILVTLRTIVNYVGWGLVGVLGIVSVVVISNTIRLTVFARRKEINIMKFVGATNAFIRLPFFVEGMTVGALSGILSSGVVLGIYYLALDFSTQKFPALVQDMMNALLPLEQVWLPIVVGFIAFGMVIGSLGCASSIRKHLKV